MEKNKFQKLALIYFLFSFILLTVIYKSYYKGISTPRSDGIYYYSITASILWDRDLDLQNQYDHSLLYAAGNTATNKNYYIDKRTGKAFALFNPGTGLFLLPTAVLGRIVNAVQGNKHKDPFDPYFQFYACFAAVIITSLSILMLFLIIKEFYSIKIALIIPFLFFFGSNWLFYFMVYPNWSHIYSLFCNIALIWVFIKLLKKNNYFFAALFGFVGGISFCTRNFNFLILVLLSLIYLKYLLKKKEIVLKKKVLIMALAILFSIAGAMPQFILKQVQHGNILASSYKAAQAYEAAPRFIKDEKWFEGLVFPNLFLLKSTLFNWENGLFYYHPIYLLGLLGLLLFRHKNRQYQNIINALLLVLFVFWFFDTAYYEDWFTRVAGSGFGHRRYVSLIAPFALGLCNIFSRFSLRKYLKYILAGIVAVIVTAGGFLLFYFITDYKAVYSNRELFLGFYQFLLHGIFPIAVIISIITALFFVLRKGSASKKIVWRKKHVIAIISALIIIPMLIFRSSDDFLRRRHYLRDGFFWLYDLNPLVQISAKDFGLPQNRARPVISSQVDIKLPAPLWAGDKVLFKIENSPGQGKSGGITLFFGKEYIGEKKLKEGKHIYVFPLNINPEKPRDLKLSLTSAKALKKDMLIYEGRVIFKDQNRQIIERLDWLKIEGDKILGTGWCLDDHKIRSINLYCKTEEDKSRIYLGKAQRNPQTLSLRPDLDNIFVLHPELESAVYEFELPLLESLKGNKVKFWTEIVSTDGELRKSREIIKDLSNLNAR